jgi:transposase
MNELSHAREVICFDRFHISQHLGKALDKVRAKENRELLYNTGESILKGTKFEWLTNSDRTDNRSRREFLALTHMALKTARAWVIKEMASRS